MECLFFSNPASRIGVPISSTPGKETLPGRCRQVVLVVKLVGHHSCGADTLPVAVRFPAGPRIRLKTVDPPKGNGLGQKKAR